MPCAAPEAGKTLSGYESQGPVIRGVERRLGISAKNTWAEKAGKKRCQEEYCLQRRVAEHDGEKKPRKVREGKRR